ncbi:MAG: valine--tRNA ligase [Cyanobacteria bacterium SZAS-4]|nr:valine--tRNA ligase [Cyanobacteria bacterium SZAS-4]
MSTPSATKQPPESSKMAYNPAEVEAKWTKHWFDFECFDLDINPDKPKYSIALPPPNITGNLHMGHALNGTIQDVLIRLKRMQGYNVLWQPGTDHAGISTQIVVERMLKKEGLNRRDIGREKFIERVWEWRNESGNTILSQYKRLGVSFNWDRLAFTMDPEYVKAIYRAFVTLYKDGAIYRGNRICNWCPRCLTSLSDLEVEHEEEKGHLYLIKYPLVDNSGSLIVATTRPETMFGDVAVAVHPDDDRYKQFVGKKVRLPLTNREIPVIADSYVERDFGTGALKITPAHDANDWEVGQRHKLPQPAVIDADGKLCTNDYVPADLQGKDRFKVRELAVEQLAQQELLAETQEYTHGVGHCERCNTVIEPYLSDQWYVSMKELVEPAIKAVEDERIVFVPGRYAATYLDWMRNIRDWCISRQLWWGHRIPIWTCENGHEDAFEETPTECTKCGSKKFEQDPDVLDTWFSSALWPFATLGWPEENHILKEFYPTTVLSTAREIINLWVSRMIFMSFKFMKTIPFKHVLIHPVVQTPDGKRMSKSKMNAIDPLDMIDKYGADANRFLFTSMGIKGDQDVKFREDRLDEYKKFSNKLWNTGRFVLAQLEGYKPSGIDASKLTLADSWILHRYNTMLAVINEAFNTYDFQIVASELHTFTWDYFCDWYLEIAKIQLTQEAEGKAPESQTKKVLHTIFEGLMRALHPIMPFITEELWSLVPKNVMFEQLDSIMFAPYPHQDDRFLNPASEEKMEFVMRAIKTIRDMRQTFNVPASAEAEVIIAVENPQELEWLEAGRGYIQRLSNKINPLNMGAALKSPGKAAYKKIGSATIYIPLANLIDVEKTKEKLQLRITPVEKEIAKVKENLERPGFKERAPKDKVDAMVQQLMDLYAQLESIKAQLSILDETA